MTSLYHYIETETKLLPFRNGIFKLISLNENAWISLKISFKFVPKLPNDNIQALEEIMAWRRPGDKPVYQPMMVSLLTHICVTRPQWVMGLRIHDYSWFVSPSYLSRNDFTNKVFIVIKIRYELGDAVTPEGFAPLRLALAFSGRTIPSPHGESLDEIGK